MDMRGMPQGMTAFHVTIGGSYTTKDGWQGSISQHYPTFYVAAGCEADAIKKVATIIGPEVIARCESVIITVQNASWDAPHAPTTRDVKR